MGGRPRAQDLSHHAGKVLRLSDDGSVPDDNPFVGQAGYKPEIFSLGHRQQEGAAIHPETEFEVETDQAGEPPLSFWSDTVRGVMVE